MKTLIIFDTDPDGFLSAVIAGEYYEERDYVVTYQPAIRYEDPPYDLMDKDTVVVVVDFSYNLMQTKTIAEKAFNVITLDHHKTAQEELGGLHTMNIITKIDVRKAACRVVWDTYYPNEKAPFHVDYVEDMDLWNWVLPQSEAINAYFSSLDSTIEAWKEVLEENLDSVKELGYGILQYKNKTIQTLQNNVVNMEIAGHIVPVVNCTDLAIVSCLGNNLCQNVSFGATFYMTSAGYWKFSLRSEIGEGKPGIDVSEIAKQFGGGGHKQASGFKVSELFPIIEYV